MSPSERAPTAALPRKRTYSIEQGMLFLVRVACPLFTRKRTERLLPLWARGGNSKVSAAPLWVVREIAREEDQPDLQRWRNRGESLQDEVFSWNANDLT